MTWNQRLEPFDPAILESQNHGASLSVGKTDKGLREPCQSHADSLSLKPLIFGYGQERFA